MSINQSLFIVTLLLAPITSLEAQGARAEINSSQKVLELLNSSNWQDRDTAITHGSPSVWQDNQVRARLVEILAVENRIHEQWHEDAAAGKNPQGLKTTMGEGYGEYYGDLVTKVAALKDPKSLDALVSAEGGEQAAVSAFGTAAVKPLIARFRGTKNEFARLGIVRTLGKLARDKKLNSSLKAEAKELLFKDAVGDADPEVRAAAVANLARFDEKAAAETLRKIAESDEHSYVRKADKVKVYPVRDAARKELEHLEK